MTTSASPAACRVLLEDALSLSLPAELIPEAALPEGLTKISTRPRRMTLISRKAMETIWHRFDPVQLAQLTPPTPIFGPPRIVVREAKNSRPEMACVACAVENHDELQGFVNQLLAGMGIENPEKKLVYHLTLANNVEGHPRGSIAYLGPADFNGPERFAGRVFTPRLAADLPESVAKPAQRTAPRP